MSTLNFTFDIYSLEYGRFLTDVHSNNLVLDATALPSRGQVDVSIEVDGELETILKLKFGANYVRIPTYEDLIEQYKINLHAQEETMRLKKLATQVEKDEEDEELFKIKKNIRETIKEQPMVSDDGFYFDVKTRKLTRYDET